MNAFGQKLRVLYQSLSCRASKIPYKSAVSEWHLLNSYRRAIDSPTRVTSSAKRREYVRVGSTAASLPPTFPPEAICIGLSKCHSAVSGLLAQSCGQDYANIAPRIVKAGSSLNKSAGL
jgi:hypothetical protein